MIRKANLNDWKYISEISRISGYDDYINKIGIKYMLTGDIYVNDDNNNVNGFLKLEYLGDNSLWVGGLRVHPDYRRKNIGTDLMNYAISKGKIMNYNYLRTLVESINYRSMNLMVKLNLNKKLKIYFFNGGIKLSGYTKDYSKHFINDDWKFYYYNGFFYKNDSNIVYISNNRHKCYTIVSGNDFEYTGDGLTCSYKDNIGLPPDDFKSGYLFEMLLNS